MNADTTYVLQVGGSTVIRHVGATWEVSVWWCVLAIILVSALLEGIKRQKAT